MSFLGKRLSDVIRPALFFFSSWLWRVLSWGWASQVPLLVKNPLSCRTHRRHGFNPWVRKIPWRRKWQPTPVFLPGESHGQRKPGGLQSIGLQRVREQLKWLSTDIWAVGRQCLCALHLSLFRQALELTRAPLGLRDPVIVVWCSLDQTPGCGAADSGGVILLGL